MVDDLSGKWGFCRFERLQVRAFAFFARFFTSSKKQFLKEHPSWCCKRMTRRILDRR